MVAAFLLYRDETILSAGLEITVPTAPAVYPAKHVTASCWAFEQSSLFLCIMLRYISSTECSKVVNITIETAKRSKQVIDKDREKVYDDYTN